MCSSEPVSAIACTGYGPGDASVGTATRSLFSTMVTSGSTPGVYSEAPMRGILVWNSHHFNATNEPGKLDIWLNIEFAEPDEQERLLQRANDIRGIFAMRVPPFAAQEVCGRWVTPPDVDLLTISSHVHKRGARFRSFLGDFRCLGSNPARRRGTPRIFELELCRSPGSQVRSPTPARQRRCAPSQPDVHVLRPLRQRLQRPDRGEEILRESAAILLQPHSLFRGKGG
jgi:hypothetical protein